MSDTNCSRNMKLTGSFSKAYSSNISLSMKYEACSFSKAYSSNISLSMKNEAYWIIF